MASEELIDALEKLEAAIRQDEPALKAFFGGEQPKQALSGPVICWWRVRGVPSQTVHQRPEAPNQLALASDMVQVTARVVGASRSNSPSKPPRRELFRASLRLLLSLRQHLNEQWNGFCEEQAWEMVEEDLADAGCGLDFTFSIRLDVLYPAPGTAQPNSIEPTYEVANA